MANVTDLQTKYSKLAQEYSKVNPFLSRLVVITPDIKALKHRSTFVINTRCYFNVFAGFPILYC